MFAIFAILGDPGPRSNETARDEDEVQRLVAAARDGDRDASARLYRLHVARVFRAVRPLCGSDAEAEDVTQDAFVRALSSLSRYERRPGTRFVAWLATIAFNRARQRARDRARTRPTPEDELAAASDRRAAVDADATGAALDLARTKAALLDALAALPARDREVLSLRYAAELSADEVGDALGLSAENVRKICERRRRELLAAIEARLQPPQSGRTA